MFSIPSVCTVQSRYSIAFVNLLLCSISIVFLFLICMLLTYCTVKVLNIFPESSTVQSRYCISFPNCQCCIEYLSLTFYYSGKVIFSYMFLTFHDAEFKEYSCYLLYIFKISPSLLENIFFSTFKLYVRTIQYFFGMRRLILQSLFWVQILFLSLGYLLGLSILTIVLSLVRLEKFF